MTTITDNLDIARVALAEMDDFTTEEAALRSAPVAVETEAEGSRATMEIEGQPIRLSEHAMKQLAADLNIPTAYLIKCPAPLQAQNIEYWQRQLSERKRVKVIIGLDEIQAITSPNFVPIPNTRLFDAMVEKIGRGDPAKIKLDHFEHSWTATRIALTNADASHEVKNLKFKDHHPEALVGDVVRLGANLINSLTSDLHTEIQPFAFRLICANRNVVPLIDSSQPFFRFPREGPTPSDWIAGAIDAIGEQFEPLFEALDAAAEQKLSNPEQVIRDVLRSVPGHMREEVMSSYYEEPLDTVWGVINALSRAAQSSTTASFTHRLQVERFAGTFVTAPNICSKCGRPSEAPHVH